MGKEHFTNSDRDHVSQWMDVAPERRHLDLPSFLASVRENLRENIEGLSTRPPRANYAYNTSEQLFASTLGDVASTLTHQAIAQYVLQSNPDELVGVLRLANRLQYVSDLYTDPSQSGSEDCLHVFSLLDALAINDTLVISAWIERHPAPASSGHPFTKLLCNSVTALLKNAQDLPALLIKLRRRKDSAYNAALLGCLADLIEGDADHFSTGLSELLTLYRRKVADDGLLRFVPIQVHGVYRLACRTFPLRHGFPAPDPPEDARWDAGFATAATAEPGPVDLSVLRDFSPALEHLASALPTVPPQGTWEDWLRIP